MSPDELRTTGKDIMTIGLTSPIVLWQAHAKAPYQLLDGRNRLDAIEASTGCPVQVVLEAVSRSSAKIWSIKAGEWIRDDRVTVLDGLVDPYAYVVSANIRRRHLTPEERQNALINLIARAPEKSDRQISREVGVDHKTIASARAKGEDVGSFPHVSTRVDSKGRRQPATKRGNKTADQAASPPAVTPKHNVKNSFDALGWWGSASIEERRHFIDSVGSRAVAESIPRSWEMALTRSGGASIDEIARLHKHIDELKAESHGKDITIRKLQRWLGDDDLDIPPFLDRKNGPSAAPSIPKFE
jgi:hypothetical protein